MSACHQFRNITVFVFAFIAIICFLRFLIPRSCYVVIRKINYHFIYIYIYILQQYRSFVRNEFVCIIYRIFSNLIRTFLQFQTAKKSDAD